MRRETQRRETGRPDPKRHTTGVREARIGMTSGAQNKSMAEGRGGGNKRITINLLEHLAVYKVITHITFCLHHQPHRDTGPDREQ